MKRGKIHQAPTTGFGQEFIGNSPVSNSFPSFDNNITVVPIDEEEDAWDTVWENCMAAAYWRLELLHS